jgi:uncharacterized OB-fold protein
MPSNIKDAEQSSHMAKCPKCGHVFDVTHTCNRCGHTWVPRENEEPKVCPACKSPYWNKERVRGIAKPIENKTANHKGKK